MAVFKRPRSPFWYYRFERDGRAVYRSTRTRVKAEALRVEAAARRDAGPDPLRAAMTVDQALGAYWTHARHLPSAPTIEYMLENWAAELGPGTRLARLGNAEIATAVARLRARMSDSSVNRHLAILRAALNRARDAYDAAVPALNWRSHRLREPAPRDRWLRSEQLPGLLDAAAPHIRPLILLAVLTGLRRANLASLDWSQVDLGAARLRVVQKGGRAHLVHLGAAAVAVLANLGPRDYGPVFTHRGRPLRNWRTAWVAAKRRAGLADLRWHDLRHTFATWARQSGADLELVRAALGHASIATTQRYAHHGAHELAGLADRVAETALDTRNREPPRAKPVHPPRRRKSST